MKFVEYHLPGVTKGKGGGKTFRCDNGDWAMDVSFASDGLLKVINLKRLAFPGGEYDLRFKAEDLPASITEILLYKFNYANKIIGVSSPVYIDLLPHLKEDRIFLSRISNYSAEEASEEFCRIIRQLSKNRKGSVSS